MRPASIILELVALLGLAHAELDLAVVAAGLGVLARHEKVVERVADLLQLPLLALRQVTRSCGRLAALTLEYDCIGMGQLLVLGRIDRLSFCRPD